MLRTDFPMRCALAALLGLTLAAPVQARELDETCRARSRYDLTVSDAALLFERAASAQQRVEMRRGRLTVNGAPVPLNGADRSRVATFESTVRALVPQIKTLAQRAVDLGAAAVREEAANVSPRSAADPQLNARVDARARELKARIAASVTTKEWRGAAFSRYVGDIAIDVLPLVAGDLAQQALEAAMQGDLAGAARLKDRAVGLRGSLEARIRTRVEVLEPDVARLCPSLRRLDALESGLAGRLPDGSRLDLIEIGN